MRARQLSAAPGILVRDRFERTAAGFLVFQFAHRPQPSPVDIRCNVVPTNPIAGPAGLACDVAGRGLLDRVARARAFGRKSQKPLGSLRGGKLTQKRRVLPLAGPIFHAVYRPVAFGELRSQLADRADPMGPPDPAVPVKAPRLGGNLELGFTAYLEWDNGFAFFPGPIGEAPAALPIGAHRKSSLRNVDHFDRMDGQFNLVDFVQALQLHTLVDEGSLAVVRPVEKNARGFLAGHADIDPGALRSQVVGALWAQRRMAPCRIALAADLHKYPGRVPVAQLGVRFAPRRAPGIGPAYIELHAVGAHLGNVRYRHFRCIGSLSAQHRHTQSEDPFFRLIHMYYLWFRVGRFRVSCPAVAVSQTLRSKTRLLPHILYYSRRWKNWTGFIFFS